MISSKRTIIEKFRDFFDELDRRAYDRRARREAQLEAEFQARQSRNQVPLFDHGLPDFVPSCGGSELHYHEGLRIFPLPNDYEDRTKNFACLGEVRSLLPQFSPENKGEHHV